MLGHSARVTVENDRLSSDLHYVVNGTEPGSHIDKFNIRLSLSGRVTERRNPHCIELICLAVLQNRCFLGNQSRNTAMGLECSNRSLHGDEFSESASSGIRHSQLCPELLVQLLVLLI